jgi:hypothetical protein
MTKNESRSGRLKILTARSPGSPGRAFDAGGFRHARFRQGSVQTSPDATGMALARVAVVVNVPVPMMPLVRVRDRSHRALNVFRDSGGRAASR